jgi:hypothetical protein
MGIGLDLGSEIEDLLDLFARVVLEGEQVALVHGRTMIRARPFSGQRSKTGAAAVSSPRGGEAVAR